MSDVSNSIWVAHPTGNTFVRALLEELEQAEWDYKFLTTLGVSIAQLRYLPSFAREELKRRSYNIPSTRLVSHPLRELTRLLLQKSRLPSSFGCSVDAIYQETDRFVCANLKKSARLPSSVYLYEDAAADTFQFLDGSSTFRNYELPIAYYKTGHKLLAEEAERYPEWRETLGSVNDSTEKLARKDQELALADRIIIPSQFVLDSLPDSIRCQKECVLSPFGSPAPGLYSAGFSPSEKLKVLFAGSFTQRKGLADLFAAMRLLRPNACELTLMGSPILPLEFYTRQTSFKYESPRAHEHFLAKMSESDVLVLPSIVEGRALVQQEALACGLPIIVTPNAGGEDLVVNGETGFLVPIRAPENIAQCLEWCISHRKELHDMRMFCRSKAAQYSWKTYARKNLDFLS